MTTYTTDAIVIKKIPSGEFDAMFTLYTEQFGKMNAKATGIQREAAKLKGHLEPLNHSAVQFVLGKAGEKLTHAMLIEYWPCIRRQMHCLQTAQHILHLVDTHCMGHEHDTRLWNIIIDHFILLEKHGVSMDACRMVWSSFKKEFLASLGFRGATNLQILDHQSHMSQNTLSLN